MRLIRLVPFAALLMLTASATCVTDVRQKGPEGPWVGEVVNGFDQSVQAIAEAAIFDAENRFLLMRHAPTCPMVLLPGEGGAFELSAFAEDGQAIEYTRPLRAEFARTPPVIDSLATYRSDGLLAELVGTLDGRRIAIVRVTNNSEYAYHDLRLCGILFDAGGATDTVAHSTPDTASELAPGRSRMINLFFAAGTNDTLRLYPSGVSDDAPPLACCVATAQSDWRKVDTEFFSVMLPPRWIYNAREGTDTFVGNFTGDGVEVSFNCGFSINQQPLEGEPGYNLHYENIGPYRAKIAIPMEELAMRVFMENPSSRDFDDDIGFYASDLDPSAVQTVLQIIRSVRFADERC